MREQTVRRVLVATDLSEATPALIMVGVDAARKFGAELVVLHVFDPEGYEKIFGETGISIDRFVGYLRTELHDQVQAAGVELPVRLEIAEGCQTAREIVASATRLNVELIVIGARRRQGLRRAFSGGVGGEVLRLATTPVLVAPASLLDVVRLEAAAS